MIAIARVTAEGQTVIPPEIREALHVGPGDSLVWEIGPDGEARVRRVQLPEEDDYLKALETTLMEWLSPWDEDAYRDL